MTGEPHPKTVPRKLEISGFIKCFFTYSSGVILVHNHPSGNPMPSKEDKLLTKEIAEAAYTLEIRVLDHLIVGKDGYFSFMENSLLPAITT